MKEINTKDLSRYFNSNLPKENSLNSQESSDNCEKKCVRIFTWIFQIMCWFFLLLVVIFISTKNFDGWMACLIIFITFYCLYIPFEIFYSPTSIFLRNISSSEGIYQNLVKYFKTGPKILLNCESFHMETTTYITTDSNGYRRVNNVTEKVVTHKETLDFPYYSSRDVSGMFNLNCDQASINDKCFIKLELIEDINFADPISYMDYVFESNIFYERNVHRDRELDFTMSRTVPGMIRLNLIKIGDSQPLTINFFFFVVSTILTLAEPYKSYVNSFCIQQKFTVRKLVSTRFDLNQPEFDEIYQGLNPKINLITKRYDFPKNDYNYINNDCQVNIPSKEEINLAQEFQGKIPVYRTSNAGVVLDNNNLQGNHNININKDIKNDNKGVQNEVNIPLIQIGEQGYIPPQV